MGGNRFRVSGFALHILRPTQRSAALRNTFYLPAQNVNILISLLIFAAAFYGYTSTLAPTVIEGDAALFQYTPYVLGVTYPTGFPLYILLGKLWVTIFPFGEIAWRMNLLSALCSSLALPLIYNATRRLFNYQLIMNSQKSKIPIWAALLTTGVFATLPTFWRWSTEAKTYAANILLFSLLLLALARALEIERDSNSLHASRVAYYLSPALLKATRHPLVLPSLLLGLMISVHNTGVLLVPGYLTLAGLHFRHDLRRAKSAILYLALLALPGLFYLYIPLRAEWLIARYGRQEAIARGLLADFYHSGLDGWFRYFTGVGFTEGVVSNWGQVPQQFFTVYLPLLAQDFTWPSVALGVIGGLGLAVTRPRLFLPLFLMYAVPIPFVIVYGQGEQSAFLLPSFLIFAIFVGNILIVINQLTRYALRLFPLSSLLPPALLLLISVALIAPQIRHNIVWLTVKWNRDIYNEWADALNHPLEPGAGMLAHWGDLTSFWYMQHAENRRPDLRGIYPPTEEIVIGWLNQGNNLYIAGPLQGWAEGIQQRYQLIPWGRLVRIAPQQASPRALLPVLPQPVEVNFANRLRLLGVDYAPQAVSGHDFPVTLTWQTLAQLPPATTISLRLTTPGGLIVAQLDDRLRSGWFPSDTLPANQHLLSYALLPVPLGTLPGPHRLQLVAYTNVNAPWALPDGRIILDLGQVEITPPAGAVPLNPSLFKPLPAHDFNGEIELAGYDYSVARVGQGKGFAIRLMWLARRRPANNYSLLVEALDARGQVLRSIEHQPLAGRAPTASWQPGQFVRDQVDFVAPAGAPPGDEALQIRLSWLRPDGSTLALRRWRLLPWGDGLKLGWLTVTEKEGRVFELPAVQRPIEANLANQVRLVGFDTPLANGSNNLQLNMSTCPAGGCQIKVTLYWQGQREMAELYQVFFHVVDAQGRIVAQHDGVPGLGKQPTTGWLPGEVVADPVEIALPPNLPAGQYTLRVGMYLPPDGPRLFIVDGSGQPAANFIDLGRLEVVSK